MAVRNPTKWRPPSGQGYILLPGSMNLVTNAGKTLITNNIKIIITNGQQVVGKYATAWTLSGA